MTDSAKALALLNDVLTNLNQGTVLAARIKAMMAGAGAGVDPEPSPQPDPAPDPIPEPLDREAVDYLNRYPDVAKVAKARLAKYDIPLDESARWHYKHWGKAEGRSWGVVEASGGVTGQRRFHHYNASAWHDRGVAVILCPGDRAESASIGGKKLRRHGNLDKGREVWADYRTRGLTGALSIVIDGVAYVSEITSSGVTEGDCWSRG